MKINQMKFYFLIVPLLMLFSCQSLATTSLAVEKRLLKCQEYLTTKKITKGKKNALSCYHSVLQAEPDNQEALNALNIIFDRYVQWMLKILDTGNCKIAKKQLLRLKQAQLDLLDDPKVHKQYQSLCLKKLITFQDSLKGERYQGPKMVMIDKGHFTLGNTIAPEPKDEQPTQDITLEHDFAISQYEITVQQYTLFAKATNRTIPDNMDWGPQPQPVVNVSWEDANAYVKWLSSMTGYYYRLPSEIEWEYVAKANSVTLYPWGDVMKPKQANCRDCNPAHPNQPQAVGSYPINEFGVYDMLGNVWEWTNSCYHPYPIDTNTDTDTDCVLKSVRGGAWDSPSNDLRPSNRGYMVKHSYDDNVGFRVVKILHMPTKTVIDETATDELD